MDDSQIIIDDGPLILCDLKKLSNDNLNGNNLTCGLDAGCHPSKNLTSGYCVCTYDLKRKDPITGCRVPDGALEYNATNLRFTLNNTILPGFNDRNKFNSPPNQNDSKVYITLILFICLTLTLLLFTAYIYFRRKRFLFRNEMVNNRELAKIKSPVSVQKLSSSQNYVSNPNYYASALESFFILSTNIKQYEIPSDRIEVNEEIGEGAFGKVFKATLNGDEKKLIAIKMIKQENRDTITQEFLYDFDREVKILSKFKHKNIIEFLGVVRLDSTKLSFSMVFEYMPFQLNQLLRDCSLFQLYTNKTPNYYLSPNDFSSKDQTLTNCSSLTSLNCKHYYLQMSGHNVSDQDKIQDKVSDTTQDAAQDINQDKNLDRNSDIAQDKTQDSGLEKSSLETNKTDQTDQKESKSISKLYVKDLFWISSQVSAGMLFLKTHNITHRDLATRNILLDENLTVKISDFGMSREIYNQDYYKIGGGNRKLPVRWMSPESLLYGRFNSESDVWSYGVLLWEIWTNGRQPYFGFTNNQAIQLILDGHLLTPPRCPPIICEIMSKCWKTDPRDRIKFETILSELANYCTPEQREDLLSSIDN